MSDSQQGTDLGSAPVAYFCAEFGIDVRLPLYAGGLGVLAGDHCKAASDFGVPLVAVGLLYTHGAFAQHIASDGWQHAVDPAFDVLAARMQAKADALSALARHQGASAEVRDLIARTRCNDAYWHGVFGGLYLRHLRGEIWRQLARAEGLLRAGASLSVAPAEGLGGVGRELHVHSSQFSAVIALDRGGALVEWLDFGLEVNVADVLTRRWEHAHLVQPQTPDVAAASTQTTSLRSIHEREGAISLPEVPANDADERHLTAERIVSESVTAEQWQRAEYTPIRSWGRDVAQQQARRTDATDTAETTEAPQTLSLNLALPGWGNLHKTLTFEHDGVLQLTWRWDAGAFPPDALFTVELSVASPVELRCDPQPLAIWRYDIVTWSRSESGVEPIVQGESITPSWPVSAGACALWVKTQRPRRETS